MTSLKNSNLSWGGGVHNKLLGEPCAPLPSQLSEEAGMFPRGPNKKKKGSMNLLKHCRNVT